VTSIPFLDIQAAYHEDQLAIDSAYARVMRSGRWILGPELEAFEAEYAAYCGTGYCVGVGNGLDALYLALKAMDIGPGDEVIVPSHTFVATWLAVTRTGATPVPAEPDGQTYMPVADAIEACVTTRTRAIIAVHLYGSVAGIEEIAAMCASRGIPLIEDAAQAHGALSSVARAGNHGIMGCFSFYPSKNLGAFGDGGAVVTNDPTVNSKLRALRNYGGVTRYAHELAGINTRLDELQAAFLRVQLTHLDARNARRKALATLYLQELHGIDDLQLPRPGEPGSHVWHLFVVQTNRRDALQQHLFERGCETLIHYPKPVYRYSPFETFAPRGESTADRLCARVLSLPTGPNLSHDAVRAVCDAISAFYHKVGRGRTA